jgi:uncharacterized membrane protein YeiB
MAGVVTMNYIGYLILRGAPRGGSALADIFDPWTGPLSTRFAATFVVVAGVGVALMRSDRRRGRLASRGLVLLMVGLAFDIIWRGAILPYYGLLFLVAAIIVSWPTWSLWLLGIASAVAAWALNYWVVEARLAGDPLSWLSDPSRNTPHGFIIDMSVNGTHPILPWLSFFAAGIIIGRTMADGSWLRRWRLVVLAAGVVLWFVAGLVRDTLGTGSVRRAVLWSTDPFDRGIAYTLSALASALVALALIDLVVQYATALGGPGTGRVVSYLQTAGQVSLTVYVAHALVFNLVVDWLGWVTPGSLATALFFAATVAILATVTAVWWARRFGRGPFETLYRAITL